MKTLDEIHKEIDQILIDLHKSTHVWSGTEVHWTCARCCYLGLAETPWKKFKKYIYAKFQGNIKKS